MKLIMQILMTAVLCLFLQGFLELPWWSAPLAAAIAAIVFGEQRGLAFVGGFIGVFLVWSISAYFIDGANESYLSSRVAEILPLNGSSLVLVILTGVIGGIFSAFTALTGAEIRYQYFQKSK